MKLIEINAPFYGAGSPKMYNWVKDGFDIYGIGINVEDLNAHDKLQITAEGNTYEIATEKIKEFVKKYNSYYKVKKGNVLLGVFSKSLFMQPFNVAKWNEQFKKVEKPDPQKPLF